MIWLLACTAAPHTPDTQDTQLQHDTQDTRDTQDTQDTGDTQPDVPDTDHCWAIRDFEPVYDDVVHTWADQDDRARWPAGALVFTGSSSIRRWEDLARSYSDLAPLQRGFGGAQIAEVALRAQDLVLRHDPAGVVVFAGTNDVAAGVAPDDVVARFRCLRERIWTARGQDFPVLFIGITPTPSRWASWDQASAVNEAVQSLAAADPGLTYVDVPTAFLATGSPPDAGLFVADQLHLSESGYALWDSVLRPSVDAALSPRPNASGGLVNRLFVDFGASDGTNGEHSASPDHLGHHWNNWHALSGGDAVLPGERLADLVDQDGASTGVDVVITGGFQNNGRQNGGLLWPETELLDDLAVGTATQDYFYSVADGDTGGFFVSGLDPARTYALRLFASRDTDETRVTTYVATGATSESAALQTSGDGAGSSGTGNDDDVVELSVQPDPWGRVFVDVQLTQGSYAYVAALEIAPE